MSLVNRILQESANILGIKAGKVISGLESEGIKNGVKFNLAEAVATGAEKVGNKAAIAEARAAAKAGNSAAASALTFLGAPLEETAEQTVKEGSKELTKKASSGIGKNALIGGATGALVGGGAGGIAGIATGADEDDMKSMVAMGAIAGGAGGAIVGGTGKMIRNLGGKGGQKAAQKLVENGADVAADIVNNESNRAVKGGANGLIEKAGASIQNISDKIDKIGYNVQHKYTGAKGREASKIIAEMQEAGEFNTIDKESFIEGLTGGIKRKGAALGGAAQGAIMGSATGAVIGGVAGGIDEDETVLGGALKGGFIGGTLGGIGGGASGYFNNSGKVLANTTANVNSLFK